MSLLVNESYAGPSTPLWLSAGGGTINGNLTLNGAITAGRVAASKEILSGFGNFALIDASGSTMGGVVQQGTAGASDVVIQTQSGRKVIFGLVAGSGGNTSLTPSAAGANTDLLTVGGTVDALALKLANTGGAATVGSATLSAGGVVVSTTASDVNSYILLSRTAINASTALGELRVSNKGANNFTVISAQPATPTIAESGDASSFDWVIINPA